MAENVVGETRFELATLCSQSSKESPISAGFAVEQRKNATNGINGVAGGCLTDLSADVERSGRTRSAA